MYNPDVHHRHSIRLREYDYSSAGAYFVTICAFQRECLFGEVNAGNVICSEAGIIIDDVWRGLVERFPSVVMSDHVVMPNHVHGIVVFTDARRGAACRAPDDPDLKAKGAASSAPTLGEVLRAFKSISAVSVNRVLGRQGIPLWQRNYHEHIIRSEDDLANIRQYIANNPLKWDLDENNPVNLMT